MGQTGAVILVTNLVGLVFIEYTWDACYLCANVCQPKLTKELYFGNVKKSMPTEMRATAVGSCSLMARAGAIIAPILAYLNTIWTPSGYLVVTVFGSLNLFISYKWLIETRGSASIK
uniref:Major facilitator superfamily (MFS) profile domain-containing protein n=1 Tax=Ditylenchus dipsaci TaxID=166011 RepID=A0A915DY01_9BILA